MSLYLVVVGNIGTVYMGESEEKARFHARVYIELSKQDVGRCAGEPVTILKDQEILDEYPGDLDEESV